MSSERHPRDRNSFCQGAVQAEMVAHSFTYLDIAHVVIAAVWYFGPLGSDSRLLMYTYTAHAIAGSIAASAI